MKPFTGRLAPQKNEPYFVKGVCPTPFGPGSLAWQLNLPGIPGLAALRGLLRQASTVFGDGAFPYARVADTLLHQQMAIFGGGVPRRSRVGGHARRWGQAVWLDRTVRERLSSAGCAGSVPPDRLYPEYLRFAEVVGLNAAVLPAGPDEFDAWAQAGVADCQPDRGRKMTLGCLTEPTPLFWPVNVALIFYLLPEEFRQFAGVRSGMEPWRLAGVVQGIF